MSRHIQEVHYLANHGAIWAYGGEANQLVEVPGVLFLRLVRFDLQLHITRCLGGVAIRELGESRHPSATVLAHRRERERAGLRGLGLESRSDHEPLQGDVRANLEAHFPLEPVRPANARNCHLHARKSRRAVRAPDPRASVSPMTDEQVPDDVSPSDPSSAPHAVAESAGTTPGRVKRPTGVTFVVGLVWIAAIADLVAGIVLLLISFNNARFHDAPVDASVVRYFSLVAIVIGLLTVMVAVGLAAGSQFARVLTVVVMSLRLLNAAWALIAIRYVTLWPAVVDLALALLVISLLSTRAASDYYRNRT